MNHIPRVIFCFWFGNEMSENRAKCFSSIVETSGVDVKLITEKNLNQYILKDYPLHPEFNFLSAVHKSDYLRSYFMYFYGGGYTDIKMNSHLWEPYFVELENSDKDFIGSSETHPKHVCVDNIRDYYQNLVGPVKFIFKKNTIFGKLWFDATHQKMNDIYYNLKNNPGWYHPRAEKGGAQGISKDIKISNQTNYPLHWNELLGQIFHKLQFENQDKFLKTLPKRAQGEYL
jgi:hypothetical protein